jgi:hypothetical protein
MGMFSGSAKAIPDITLSLSLASNFYLQYIPFKVDM